MSTRPKRPVLTAAALAALAPVLVAGQAAAAATPVQGADLSPVTKSLDLGPAGRILAARNTEAGVQVVAVRPGTTRVQQVLATIPGTPDDQATAADASGLGQTWVIYGGGEGPRATDVYLVNPSGSYRKVLSMSSYQASDPDPYDLEGIPGDSNPYDLTALSDGTALVADAAGNDLVRVWPDGHAVTVACFPDELVSTEDVPAEVAPPGTLPPQLPAEAVPTGVAVSGRYAYVSELKGFPFAVGSSKVYRVDAYGAGQGCSGDPEHPVQPGPVVADGLTAANDVSVGPDASLYVTELSTLGVWAIEAGDSPGGGPDPSGTGEVVKVASGGAKSVAASGLTVPGSAVMGRDGHLYVTDMFLFAARLLAVD